MVMIWEDLTVTIGADNKKLLDAVTGFAQPGRIMAVMGPSGCGKTTLLTSLAGTHAANVTEAGNIQINGKRRNLYSKQVSFVGQEELFLGTLTVKETLTYSANMRLPSKMTKQEIDKVVEDTIIEMGLEDCANTKIGNWHLRGISNGEKKRLSIGLEILTQPFVLLLDEPTSGLDSASAFYVIQALSNIAFKGKIVICSIHQPGCETFNIFDDLLLLSNGETVYFGEAKMALKFFADAGFPCPIKRNPSDHFLMSINLDFDFINEALARCHVSIEILCNSNIVRSSANWWKQLSTLTKRSFLNMNRDLGYYWLRIIFYILTGITIGTLFFHIGTGNSSILARGKCVSFIYGFMISMSCGGLPFFIVELKVFYGERSKGHCGEAAFVISNLISSFPFLLLVSISSGVVIYFMVQFHPGFENCTFFCINLFCCLSVVESCIMVVAAIIPNVMTGIGTGTGFIIFMMMPSQIFRPLNDLPKFFWRYPMSYLSFASWAVQGQYKNDMLGVEFDPLLPGGPKVTGEQVLPILFGVSLSHGKWLDLTVLVILLFLHRLLLFLVLRYNKRGISHLLWIYAMGNLQFAKRGLLKKKPSMSSKKQEPTRPLSSLENAMSPDYAILKL
ncbi:ABC transporter G family member 15-like [Trifolium pratense]|uniref:ABC transporter G family member 15-like n=1 Tax=Trifolium pratense TaxID=57577 RepID=UPI001E6911D2|nr:ABC transporter G family member 15-like [Trifolium pratense]